MAEREFRKIKTGGRDRSLTKTLKQTDKKGKYRRQRQKLGIHRRHKKGRRN